MSKNGISPADTLSPERNAHKNDHDTKQVVTANAMAPNFALSVPAGIISWS